MTSNCDELLRILRELRQRKQALEEAYSALGSRMGSIADNASMDSAFDRLSEKEDELVEELDEVQKSLNEIESKLRASGCIPED
jgi:chromosome segregation ATPase